MTLNEETVRVSDLCSVVDAGCFGAGAGAMFHALVSSMHPGDICLPIDTVAEDAENTYAYIVVCSGVARVNAATPYAPIRKYTKRHLSKRAKDIAAMLDDDAFYWHTIYAAPAGGIHFMSDEEIVRFGLLTKPLYRSSGTVVPFGETFRTLRREVLEDSQS